MSMTGPGCPACDYSGRTTLDGATPATTFDAIPCGACSPWSHGDDFPNAELRAKAAAIVASRDATPFAMREWARRLTDYAAEVDADRAPAVATLCATAQARCSS